MTEENNPQDDSVLGKWGKAGSSLGSMAGKVTKKVREELSADDRDGINKLKSDASEAVGSFKSADSKDDYLAAGKDFAKDAGSFLKGFAGSVKSAVNEARDSAEGESAKAAFSSAVESSRDKLDDTVDNVRAKKDAKGAKHRADETAAATDTTFEPEEDIIEGEVIPNQDDTPKY